MKQTESYHSNWSKKYYYSRKWYDIDYEYVPYINIEWNENKFSLPRDECGRGKSFPMTDWEQS